MKNLEAISLKNKNEKPPSVIFLTRENNCFLTVWKLHKLLFSPHSTTAISNFKVSLRPQVSHIIFELQHLRELFLGQGWLWISFYSFANWQYHLQLVLKLLSVKCFNQCFSSILFFSSAFQHCWILKVNHRRLRALGWKYLELAAVSLSVYFQTLELFLFHSLTCCLIFEVYLRIILSPCKEC